MTVTAQGLSPQWQAMPGMGAQPGSFSPPFPAPIGAEQFLGIPYAQGFQPSIWPQPAYAWQTPYGTPTSPYGQLPSAQSPPSHSGYMPAGLAQPGVTFAQPQFFAQFIGQILPVAQQVILPQVMALTVPLIQQLVTQLAALQIIGSTSWAQPVASQFVPAMRQHAGLY